MSKCDCCKNEEDNLLNYKGYNMCSSCYMGYVSKVNVCENNVKYETEINQLKQENEKLFLQLSKQEIDEHKPVYCTLAGNDCKYLGKIKELKQQLAEKQKTIDEINKEFVQAVHDWKALCAEKDEELRKYKSYKTDDERIKDLTNLYSQYKEENNQLKKELKDKDFALECKERDIKAIERQRDKAYDDYGYLDKISRELGLQNVDYEKQIALLKSSEKCLTERIKNQTQLAIQELEKVKEYCDKQFFSWENTNFNETYDNQDVSHAYYDVGFVIQQQINALKGEKDVKD